MKKYIILLLAVVALFATSCVTQKKCNNKFPPITLEKEVYIHDTVNTKEIIRDTTFIVKAGKDTTIYKTDTVTIKNGVTNSNKVITEGKYATATGQVVNSKLIVKLEERSYDLEVKLKGALRDKEIYKKYYEISKEKQAIVKKVKVGKFYVWFFWILLGIGVLAMVWRNRKLLFKFI